MAPKMIQPQGSLRGAGSSGPGGGFHAGWDGGDAGDGRMVSKMALFLD
jgi:hypothetical protein